jgi:ATP-dependent Zn protease
MQDNTWLIPVFVIGPIVLGMAALFIALAFYSRKASQNGSPPGAVSYKTSPQKAGNSSANPNSQMSKSGALVLAAGECKTRFSDVAGCSEAKEELQEIVQYLLEPGIFQEMVGGQPDQPGKDVERKYVHFLAQSFLHRNQ